MGAQPDLDSAMPKEVKDKRREDLVIPYVHTPEAVQEKNIAGTFATTLPIAAIFLRSRMMSWVALFIALQTALNAPSERASEDMAPAWMSAGTALVGLGSSYLEFITGRPGPRPKKDATPAETVVETIVETIATAI